MDTNLRLYMAEYEYHLHQDELLHTAERAYPTDEVPAGADARTALAELLFALALWIAPEGSDDAQGRTLAHGR